MVGLLDVDQLRAPRGSLFQRNPLQTHHVPDASARSAARVRHSSDDRCLSGADRHEEIWEKEIKLVIAHLNVGELTDIQTFRSM